MTIADISLAEGNAGTKNAAVVVSLSQPRPNQAVTVNYATQNGTAVAGADYVATAGKLTFAPGETTKTILVPVTGDRLVEPDEYFLVNLQGAKGAKIGDAQGIVSIVDDDPRISIADVSGQEGNSGTTPFAFSVSLSSASDRTVTVNYATQNDTAVAGTDYVAVSDVLTFAPGETSKTIFVPVIGDRGGESDESFYVNLQGGTNAIIADGQGLATIFDDEPRISITGVSDYEGNAGNTPFIFTVSLAAAYDQAVRVDFATQDYTAVAGVDYLANSGTLTFAAGETAKTITVEVIGNTTPEPQKDFFVNLSGASTNAVVSNTGYGSIVDDDGYYYDPGYYDPGYYDPGYYYYDYGYYGW